ncbi:MAG: methyltransferase domain-containing protein [Candidatus Omnitrophica bacterium]|nr:methyltransferase domain-containing protein [Candidatus Omnitrophota bacterium]
MEWNKDTTKECAASYRDFFSKTIVGEYTDYSEQYPVVRSMRLEKDSFLLDAGCGTGRFLANTVPGQRFVGLDVSLEMLKTARDELKRGFFVVGKLEELPFKDNVFDEIICVRALQHITDQQHAIKEFSRICKTGGDIIALCLNSWTLHCLYKDIRMGKAGEAISRCLKSVLGEKSLLLKIFAKWPFAYDNYCSLPELCRLFRKAGLEVAEKKGGTLAFAWALNYSYIGSFLHKLTPVIKPYLKICTFLERRLESILPFDHLMDTVTVKGKKL